VIMGRTLRVDHTRYKKKDDEPDDGEDPSDLTRQIEDPDGENRRKRERSVDMESEEERPLIKEERELAQIIHEHNDEDPMKAYLIREKKEEIALALTKAKDGKRLDKGHRHRHHHRSRRHKDAEWEEEDTRRSRHSIEDHGRGTLRFKDDSPKDDGRHTRRLSETEIYGFKTRRRSPRTDSRDRDRERDNDRKWRRRDDAAEGSRRRTKRDSRDL
jgi:RNA-binding motif X-linked protein 2